MELFSWFFSLFPFYLFPSDKRMVAQSCNIWGCDVLPSTEFNLKLSSCCCNIYGFKGVTQKVWPSRHSFPSQPKKIRHFWKKTSTCLTSCAAESAMVLSERYKKTSGVPTRQHKITFSMSRRRRLHQIPDGNQNIEFLGHLSRNELFLDKTVDELLVIFPMEGQGHILKLPLQWLLASAGTN